METEKHWRTVIITQPCTQGELPHTLCQKKFTFIDFGPISYSDLALKREHGYSAENRKDSNNA